MAETWRPNLKVLSWCPALAVGKALAKKAREKGLFVIDVSRKQAKYDLIIQSHRVQCKFVGDGRSDIAPRGRDRNGMRKYHKKDFDIIAVAWRSVDCVYLVPSELLAGSDGWLLTKFATGRFHSYKEAWHIFDKQNGDCPHSGQMDLF